MRSTKRRCRSNRPARRDDRDDDVAVDIAHNIKWEYGMAGLVGLQSGERICRDHVFGSAESAVGI